MFTGYLQDQDARLEDINKSLNCINPAPRRGDAAQSCTPTPVVIVPCPRRPTLDSPVSRPYKPGTALRPNEVDEAVGM